MATLTRPKPLSEDVGLSSIPQPPLDIPKPFPRTALAETETEQLLESLAAEELQLDTEWDAAPAKPPTVLLQSSALQDSSAQSSVQAQYNMSAEVIPSIAHVQKSCLMTLNNLLSNSSEWRPIIPDRRHSMPPRAPAVAAQSQAGHFSALYTLVRNLRTQDSGEDMIQAAPASEDAALIRELQIRVERVAESLTPSDAQLVTILVSLLAHFHRLGVIQMSQSATARASWGPSPVDSAPPSADPFACLKRHVSDFQLERSARSRGESSSQQGGVPPVLAVETELLWARIDEALEKVLALCRERTDVHDLHPPEYDQYDFGYDVDDLPQYEPGSSAAEAKAVNQEPLMVSGASPMMHTSSEKMRMDLEAITLAIDRLYLVAPQLHNQRVELKKSKLEQMRRAAQSGVSGKGKERERERDKDVRELEQMMELIHKASERKMVDQSVLLEGGLKAKFEKARLQDKQRRDAFVEQLVHHSDAGRLHSQDAVASKTRDPDAMLSLPEFIRESMPESVRLKMQIEDSTALLTLPEVLREPVPNDLLRPPPLVKRTSSWKASRNRSMSAPPLAWLLTSSRPSSPSASEKKQKASKSRRPGSSGSQPPIVQTGLDVNYVAEYHENLQHILVFLSVSGLTAGINVEAEVLPSSASSSGNESGNSDVEHERLLITCGGRTSSLLKLPARAARGRKEVRVATTHYEVKIGSVTPASGESADAPALLDATQLSLSRPTSFICSSCSLPLVQSSRLDDYRDLPSEHWAELVEAWMCHADQKLHEQVQKNTRDGFWPKEGQALVGGSYVLFEESTIVKNNLSPVSADDNKHGDDWRRVRCICGAIIGRCQEHELRDGLSSMVYRLAKYAIRPVSPTTEPSRVPLSAFIVEDMQEFVRAHATYRFVVFDEEEERARILIWLFKPSMRLSYSSATQYVIPKDGSIHAAKVLFKTLGPSTTPSELQSLVSRHPGFPQAEHLYYPFEICRRLAGLLKESNTAYPDSMRTMTGLDVGWLQRA